MYKEKLNFEIQPIFKTYPSVYNNFLRIEKDCYSRLGYADYDYDLDVMRGDYVYAVEKARNHFAFGAYYDYEMIGFALGQKQSDNSMYLSHLFIDPVYQGHGVGEQLLKRVENLSIMYSQTLKLFSLPDAIKFYEHYGYEHCGSKDGQAVKDKSMIKNLLPQPGGVIPVFEWVDSLNAKLNIDVDKSLLKINKYQPFFVCVTSEQQINGLATRLPNGKQYIILDEENTKLAKRHRLDLSFALDQCR